jgi:hypothetical protein
MANMGGVWNMLTLEQLQQLSDEQISQRVNERLLPQGVPIQGVFVQPADFLAAQFYVSELDRRENRRENAKRDEVETKRRRVDLALELLIVVLIGVEIILAIGGDRQRSKDAAQQLKAFSDMQVVLSHLQDTSKATAETLVATQGTMESMRIAAENQLKLFYDVNLNPVYEPSTKRLALINEGRTNIFIWEIKTGTGPRVPEKEARVVNPGGSFLISLQKLYELAKKDLAKGSAAQTPLDIFVKNAKGEEFTVQGYLVAVWANDDVDIRTQTTSVTPGWNV